MCLCKLTEITDDKIIVFEYSQERKIGNNAYDKPGFFITLFFYEQPCCVVNADKKKKDQ